MAFYEKYPPLPHILWQIDTKKSFCFPDNENKKNIFFNNIKKAFRYYVELISLYEEYILPDIPRFNLTINTPFQPGQWREKILDSVKNKTIQELLDIFNISDDEWLNQFRYGGFCRELTDELGDEILNLLPFVLDSQIRTSNNDFINLAKKGFILRNQKQKTYQKICQTSIEKIFSQFIPSADLNYTLQSYQSNIVYDELLKTTLEILKDKERFFIKFEHILDLESADKVGDIIDELRQNWEKENSLILIKYSSSSQNKIIDLIIYPITLFYNQRAIYLAGYGSTPSNQTVINYYNYRLDRFSKLFNNKYILPIGWDEGKYLQWKQENDPNDLLPDIHYQLLNNQDEIKEWKQDDIYDKLSEALGIDLERTIKTMLLRFPEDFYKGYIKGSKRHETFQRLEFKNIQEFLIKLKGIVQVEITPEEQELITKVVSKYPQDAYYTMCYRHGQEGGDGVESDVIMRLRAWGHNTEILYPTDLRKRIKEDYDRAWKLYQDC